MGEIVWEFKTKRFHTVLVAEREDMNPSDSFERAEDIAYAKRGGAHWFMASVIVYCDGEEIGRDNLGGCSYPSYKDFYAGHRDKDAMNRNCSIMRKARGENVVICHYFPDMVRLAVKEARDHIRSLPKLRA